MNINFFIKKRLKALLAFYVDLKRKKVVVFDQDNLSGENLIFATGFDKSGTTWIKSILREHPEVLCKGSGQFFNYVKEGCHFLSARGGYEVMRENILSDEWYNNSGFVWLDEQVVGTSLKQMLANAFELNGTKGIKYIADKSTVQDLNTIRDTFPKAKLLAMVRDGRDVAVSFAFHFKRKGNTSKFNNDGSLNEKYLCDVAQSWAAYNRHLVDFTKNSPGFLHIVKYEDMIADKFKILNRVFQHWHLKHSPGLINKIIKETSFEAVTGGRVRGSENVDSFQRKGIAGDWLNYFKEKEKDIFRQHAGDMLIELGYETDENW